MRLAPLIARSSPIVIAIALSLPAVAGASPDASHRTVVPPGAGDRSRAAESFRRAGHPTVRYVTAPGPPAPDGFDWEDAGLGAVGTLVLCLLGGGAALALTRRQAGDREPQTVTYHSSVS